ncbi:hypothetical protein CLOM_g22212 [Closterium sp. NIES-68]|nr:hypothetical protein CLOM_g22212 [Closterium sp. NIES-68]GJP79150.1 hypothetical protein CLOP_g9395 [Closterium sp. NIES-67]
MDALRQAVRDAALRLPKPAGVPLSYGTAGFRLEASLLDSTVQRCALLAALRSLQQGGRATGVMVTASHNPAKDNGVKIADSNGGMLAVAWEAHATRLANAATADDLLQAVEAIVEEERVQVGEGMSGQVLLARDTRESGPRLLDAALQGVALVPGVASVSCALLTTPQLHWLVWAANRQPPTSPLPCESDYFTTLASAFTALLSSSPSSSAPAPAPAPFPCPPLLVDAANGVGAPKLQRLVDEVRGRGGVVLAAAVRNAGREGEGALNEGVGADFVQKEQRAPRGFGGEEDMTHRCVSLDGDADRLVYFFHTPPSTTASEPASSSPSVPPAAPVFHLLDGDKIAALFVSFLVHTLRTISPSAPPPPASASSLPPCAWFALPSFRPISLGVVQTAYANGASTAYLTEQLGAPPAVARTGVKHVHAVAERWDVGVYFEANGHGTVLFGQELLAWLEEQAGKGLSEDSALHRLAALSRLCNQAVGDALANVLAVEAVLRCRGWSEREWSAMYQDLPSRQLKVRVADRSMFVPCEDDTRLLQPTALQTTIDDAVAGVQGGRAFVRPSGTEDVVRVYAEAATQVAADALAHTIAAAVERASPVA